MRVGVGVGKGLEKMLAVGILKIFAGDSSFGGKKMEVFIVSHCALREVDCQRSLPSRDTGICFYASHISTPRPHIENIRLPGRDYRKWRAEGNLYAITCPPS